MFRNQTERLRQYRPCTRSGFRVRHSLSFVRRMMSACPTSLSRRSRIR